MKRARHEILPDDDTSYREIADFEGVYSNAPQLDECRDLLEEWLLLRISRALPLPVVDGLELNIKEPA